MPPLDWSHLQSFVAVAEHGSLSAAARATGGSQPTLSRHISLLEEQIGARLFERSQAGVVLTERGSALLQHASSMADSAARAAFAVQGKADVPGGTVRITASQVVGTFLLPEVITALHARHPQIEIELVASDSTDNLLRREADIALRMYRPTQEDVITQHICDLDIAAYATPAYIARKGRVAVPEDLLDHDMIGYDANPLMIEGLKAAGLSVTRNFFKFRCDDQVVCWQMARAGFGVGLNQIVIADNDPTVERISGPEPLASVPLWLTAHPDLRQSPRVRRVYDFLRDALRDRLQT